MHLCGKLNRLISLISILSVLREKRIAASLVGEPLSTGVEYSHTTRHVFQTHYGADISEMTTSQIKIIGDHVNQSRRKFDGLAERIDDSIKKGHFIHVEDGESDDYMQNLLSVQRGAVPQQVYLKGGHYKTRLEVAHQLWDYFGTKFGFNRPEILTIYAPMNGKFASFDPAEGTGLLSKERIAELINAESHEDYEKAVAHAQARLRQTLKENDFTTIVLKTAPAELADILAEFRDKVAIVWTGAIRKRAKTDAYEKKFNYFQASQAGDELVALNIPIVMVSPWLGNSKMTAIVDEDYMEDFKKFLPPAQGLPPFNGFKGLASIELKKEAKFSYYFSLLADNFRDKKVSRYEKESEKLNADQREIEESETLTEAEKKEKLTELENLRISRLSLGERWSFFRALNTPNKTFREFCAMDQNAELITDPSLRASVQEVLEVQVKPSQNHPMEVEVVPKKGGNTFIVSQIDSDGLENKIQNLIDWMARGEPKRRKLSR